MTIMCCIYSSLEDHIILLDLLLFYTVIGSKFCFDTKEATLNIAVCNIQCFISWCTVHWFYQVNK